MTKLSFTDGINDLFENELIHLAGVVVTNGEVGLLFDHRPVTTFVSEV